MCHPDLESNRNLLTPLQKHGFCTAWNAGTTPSL
jgi:hypothetical protein